jgi:hypothetical protein
VATYCFFKDGIDYIHVQDLFCRSTPEQNRIDSEVEDMLKIQSPLDIEYLESVRTNPHEVIKILKKLKIGKAFGKDNIQNLILKNLPKKAVNQLNYRIEITAFEFKTNRQ